jgi:spore germination cell wall hydrolase CwlJ-like protein
VNNRNIFILGLLVIGLLLHIEYRTSTINDRIDQLEDVVVRTNYHVRYTGKDVECMARNIYYEAGTESDIGKYAVGHVTVNRVRTGYWGKTVCEVVYAPAQFSWTLLKQLPKPDAKLYDHCREVARTVLNGYGIKGLDRSLFYHADYIRTPNWVDVEYRVRQIGAHIFYNRAKGSTLEI